MAIELNRTQSNPPSFDGPSETISGSDNSATRTFGTGSDEFYKETKNKVTLKENSYVVNSDEPSKTKSVTTVTTMNSAMVSEINPQSGVSAEDIVNRQIKELETATKHGDKETITRLLSEIDLSKVTKEPLRKDLAKKIVAIMAPVLGAIEFFNGLLNLLNKSAISDDEVLPLLYKARESDSKLLREPLDKLESMIKNRGAISLKLVLKDFMEKELPKFEAIIKATRKVFNKNSEIRDAATKMGYDVDRLFASLNALSKWIEDQAALSYTKALFAYLNIHDSPITGGTAKEQAEREAKMKEIINQMIEKYFAVAQANSDQNDAKLLQETLKELQDLKDLLDNKKHVDFMATFAKVQQHLEELNQPDKTVSAAKSVMAYLDQALNDKRGSLTSTLPFTWS